MLLGRDLAAAVGALLIVVAGWSVIGTVVVPRRIRSRLIRGVAITVDATFHFIADHFDSYEPRIGFWPPRLRFNSFCRLSYGWPSSSSALRC